MHSGYFEGVLQLRNVDNELIDFVVAEMKKKPGITIAKQKKVADGLDVYVSSQRFMVNLGKKLSEEFSGELKISRRIFTTNRQSSKAVYRVSVFFRRYPFRIGQLVMHQGEKVKILHLGKKVTVKDPVTGKKRFALFKELSPSRSPQDQPKETFL